MSLNENEVISLEKQNVMQTYGRFPIVIKKGKGSKIYDVNDKEYIDFTSGIGVSSLGYGNEDMKNALMEQVNNIIHTSNLFYNEKPAILANKLVNASKMSKVFFANSGAEANEGAIKLARKYSFDKYGVDRNNIISLVDSFHGRTITTLKATGQEKFHKYFMPFTEGFSYVKKDDIAALKNEVSNGNVCAIMLEAIQGEGGLYPLSDAFVKEIFDIAKKNDVLVIFDEVQCGIGRAGYLFGFEEYGVKPDIITFAKGLGGGLPIGGFLCNEKLENVLSKGDHGSTFGGNPLSCAAGIVVLDNILKPGFLDEIKEKGEYIREKVKAFNSPKVKDIRGKGLMIGIEIEGEPKLFIDEARANGLLLLSAGSNVLRMLPPLVITYDEIDKALFILEKILK